MVTGGSATDRLLIIACSQRKRTDEELLPAIERYDGPAFRVLRRFLRQRPAKVPDILILSAEHGLVAHDLPIAAYDRKMTPARARELRPVVLDELDRITVSRSSLEILVCAGQHYLAALNVDDFSLRSNITMKVCAGVSGRKLAQLYGWLHGGPPRLGYNVSTRARGNRVHLRRMEISLTLEQVLNSTKEALVEEHGKSERYESWYVEVDGRRVAPKWLVSRLTGIPVASFHSDEARRVLQQLGLEVRRA
jgi:hypothetical protein